MVDPRDLWISQSGDYVNKDVVATMEPSLKQLLEVQDIRSITQTLAPEDRDRPLVVLCHSFPNCWRTPEDDVPERLSPRLVWQMFKTWLKRDVWGLGPPPSSGCPCPDIYVRDRTVLKVGRTMFETEKLPGELTDHVNLMDEVWVPSQFNVDSFNQSGVPLDKLYVLPQGINTTLFDPARHAPLQLSSLPRFLVAGMERPRSGGRRLSQREQQQRQQQEQEQQPHGQEGEQDGQPQEPQQAAGASALVGGLASVLSGNASVGEQQEILQQLRGEELQGLEQQQARGKQQGLEQQLGPEKHQEQQQQQQDVKQQPEPWSGESRPITGQQQEQLPAAVSAAQHAAGGQSGKIARVPQQQRPFRFLSIFKWEMRKGWDVLFKAFAQEFQAHENVELHIITHAVHEEVKDFRAYVRQAILPHVNASSLADLDRLPRVFVYSGFIPEAVYPGVYRAADALVIPTHGEGWGRPQIEAMAMGLPVISTNWSGTTAFLNAQVGYPIPVESIVDIQGEDFEWFKGGKWAQPSLGALRSLMRQVVSDRQGARAKGAAARELVLREFSLEAVARKLLQQLLRVQEKVEAFMGLPQHGGASGG